MQNAANFLDNVQLFAPLPAEYKKLVAERLRRAEFESGEVIVREGDEDASMYIIESGQVAVVHEEAGLGLQFEVAKLYPGQVFGEMSTLTNEERSATCKAAAPTVTYVLERNILFGLMQRIPEFSIQLCQIMARRLADLNRVQGKSVNADQLKYDASLHQRFPAKILERHRLVPIRIHDGVLTVATPDPENLLALDDMRRFVQGVQIKAVHISDEDYARFVQRHVRLGQIADATREGLAIRGQMTGERPASTGSARPGTRERPKARSTGQGARVVGEPKEVRYFSLENPDKDAPGSNLDPVKVLDEIILDAVENGTSDLHIEPVRDQSLVRYRVDGKLVDRPVFVPRSLHPAIMSRLKVLAQLDIAEKRMPQDGRIGFSVDGVTYDLRLNLIPTIGGEKAVLRVLDTNQSQRPLEELVVADPVCKLIKRIIQRPSGMVAVCGPASSGKTTTLYALLKELNDGHRNLTTVEDPVEYFVSGLSQTQVDERIGLGYPELIRAALRQNADVVLIGETRDAKTARIALEAGLVGNLVLTSFYANSAPGALMRLLDLGLDPFGVKHAINGIISQRLVRRICPACSRPHEYGDEARAALDKARILPLSHEGKLYRASGCEHCRGTGYQGRVALMEVMSMTDELRSAIRQNASRQEIVQAAQKGGYVAQHRYAAFLLTQGLTTPAEVLRVHASNQNQ